MEPLTLRLIAGLLFGVGFRSSERSHLFVRQLKLQATPGLLDVPFAHRLLFLSSSHQDFVGCLVSALPRLNTFRHGLGGTSCSTRAFSLFAV